VIIATEIRSKTIRYPVCKGRLPNRNSKRFEILANLSNYEDDISHNNEIDVNKMWETIRGCEGRSKRTYR